MSVLHVEELHAQLSHAEDVIWLLAHITGFVFSRVENDVLSTCLCLSVWLYLRLS